MLIRLGCFDAMHIWIPSWPRSFEALHIWRFFWNFVGDSWAAGFKAVANSLEFSHVDPEFSFVGVPLQHVVFLLFCWIWGCLGEAY